MIEIQVNGLVKSFEVGHNVLDGLTFQIDQGERVGLLGRNGAGKTTLFKILTGELDYDEGTVVVGQGRRVGLISQIPVYPAGYTVEDVLRSAFARLQSLAEEMRALEARMAAGESDPAILKRYGTLSERFEAFGGYDTDVAVNKIANGLSIPDAQRQQLFDSLSGGEKTRVNLGRLILEDTDILLLDEPTNHLDLHATEWLEDYVRRFKGTVVAISHDRYFLDRTITRVFSPPERLSKSCPRISREMDRPFATLPTAVAVSYPPMASNFSESSPYRRRVSALLSPAAMAAVSRSISPCTPPGTPGSGR